MSTTTDTRVLITGGTGGIGTAVVDRLLADGVVVEVVVREPTRTASWQRDRLAAHPAGRLEVLQADLSSIASTRRMIRERLARGTALDALILNAAVVRPRAEHTADGLEQQFAVNHVAAFLLATELGAALVRPSQGRIVVVSSRAAYDAPIDVDALGRAAPYDANRVYAETKLLNVFLMRGLDERLRSAGIMTNALHPGVVRTPLLAELMGPGRGSASTLLAPLRSFLGRVRRLGAPPARWWDAPEDAAERILALALDPAFSSTSGEFFDGGVARPLPQQVRDPALVAAVWARTESLIAAHTPSPVGAPS
jgi:NAD(P)-dependent dehydrogenase (short-subunit alcohol dehydrogenase family)